MWVNLLRESLRNLRAQWRQYLLTSLGITWGIATLLLLTAFVDGYYVYYRAQVDRIGPRLVYVFPGTQLDERIGARRSRDVEFDAEDVRTLASLPLVEEAAAELAAGLRVFGVRGRSKLLWTFGVSPEIASVRGFRVERGRFLSRLDEERGALVVVLGRRAAERLFGHDDAVGRTVHIEGVPFEVVGVLREPGETIFQVLYASDDELALVPVTTAQRWITRSHAAGSIVFAPVSREKSHEAVERTRALLKLRLGIRESTSAKWSTALSFNNSQDRLEAIERVTEGLRIFLAAAGLVPVAVGGLGVMNIMLLVVRRRRREIGLRKAVGASDAAIFVQFLLETLAVTLSAGTLGALGGISLIVLAAYASAQGVLHFAAPMLDPWDVAAQALVVTAVGLVSGLAPSLRAMRVPPAVSLRQI